MLPSRVRTGLINLHHVRTVLFGMWCLRRADLGRRVRVTGRPRVVVRQGGRMRVADRVQISSDLARTELVATESATLEIGERTLVNFGTSIVATERVSIGAHCVVEARARIGALHSVVVRVDEQSISGLRGALLAGAIGLAAHF